MRKPRSMSTASRSKAPAIESLEGRCLLSGSHDVLSFLGGIFSSGTPSGGSFHFGRQQFVVGTLVSADATANTITISNPVNGTGTSSTYALASNATIAADGSTTTLGNLLAGAEVSLQLSVVNSVTTVTSVNAISQHVAGTISSVDTTANTITLKGFNGSTTTYPVSSTAKFTLNGATTTLAGLVVGDSAALTISALDGKTATRIDTIDLSLFGHGHHDSGRHVTGTVVSTDTTADTITVSTSSTTQTTYTVDASATITADGVTTTLDKLLAGAKLQLTLSSTSSTTVVAIAASSQHVSGSVTGVDATAGTITLTPHNGTATTYTVGSATITINGSSATLASIVTGSQAQLTLSAFDDKTVTSVVDRTAAPVLGHAHAINATVVSVDATADTITVSTLIRGTTTQTTYTLATGATITADGAAVSLASFLAGAHVTLMLSASDATMVTAITATSQTVLGTVSSVDTTANTITLKGHGTTTTYPVSMTATITVNGAAGTLAGLVAGSRVNLKLSALDGMTVTSATAITPATIVHHRRILGTITAIDTIAGTITITSPFNGSSTPAAYTLAAGATITANGTTAMLGDLSAGAIVFLQITTIGTTTTVNSITALPQHANGVIGSVDTTAGTITITPHNGSAAQTYPVSSTATVTLNGATTTLAGLTAGLHVQLGLSALDGKTVLKIRAGGQAH